MTLPFEQDLWHTLIELEGGGFEKCYITVYGKDKVNGGEQVPLCKS